MKLAVLSDIHGNLPALTATLAAMEQDAPDFVAVLGDLVGYYYSASEVIDIVRGLAPIVVRGNHERALLDRLEGRDTTEDYRKKYGQALEVATRTLRPEQKDWIAGLHDVERITIGARKVLLMHEASGVDGGYLYPDADPELVASVDTLGGDVDLLLVGHTHYPFVAPLGHTMIVNPGSIGQARDLGGLAQWALIHLDTLAVELRRTPYETRAVEEAALRHDPDLSYLRDVLRRARIPG